MVLAALRGKMLRLAVERAAGAFTNFLPLVGRCRGSRPSWSRRREGFELLCRFFCLPGEREQVEPLARFMFASYATVPVYEAFFRWLGYGERIDEMVRGLEGQGPRGRGRCGALGRDRGHVRLRRRPRRCASASTRSWTGGITLPILTPITTPDRMAELIEALAPA